MKTISPLLDTWVRIPPMSPAGKSSPEVRLAHNQEVVGSNPTPAPNCQNYIFGIADNFVRSIERTSLCKWS